jgi:hypothetical protein
MTKITPVEPVHFQSKSPNLCTFFAIAPEGTRVEDVFLPAFWSRVATTSATKGNIVVDSLIRIRAVDRSFDVMLTVTALRSEGSPVLVRWPTDPFLTAKGQLPSFVPKELVEASEVLGVPINASPDDVRRAGQAMQAAWHPDHAADEADRQRREARFKQIGAALDLLLKRKAA